MATEAASCCGGSCRRKQPILIRDSDLTDRVYAVTNWRRRSHPGAVVATDKHDVTRDVNVLRSIAWREGFEAAAAASPGERVRNPYVPEGASDGGEEQR